MRMHLQMNIGLLLIQRMQSPRSELFWASSLPFPSLPLCSELLSQVCPHLDFSFEMFLDELQSATVVFLVDECRLLSVD